MIAKILLPIALMVGLSGCVVVNVAPTATPVATPSSTSTTRAIACGTAPVLLNQPGTGYRLTGDCASVSIQGQDITVTFDKIESVTINGDREHLTGHTIGSLSISGQDSTAKADLVGAVDIHGDRNTVTASTIGSRAVQGQNNVVGP